MKYTIAAFALLVASTVMAGGHTNMTDEQKQQFMQNRETVQACMAKIDQGELERVRDESAAKMKEIMGMCKAGERDKAQSAAIAFGKEVSSESSVEAMQACVGEAGITLPTAKWEELEDSSINVCDMEVKQRPNRNR